MPLAKEEELWTAAMRGKLPDVERLLFNGASPDAKLSVMEIKWGLVPDVPFSFFDLATDVSSAAFPDSAPVAGARCAFLPHSSCWPGRSS